MKEKKIKKICERCHIEFLAKQSNARYCSKRCINAARAERKAGQRCGKGAKKRLSALERLAAEATAHGMTYGKYVEMLEREA